MSGSSSSLRLGRAHDDACDRRLQRPLLFRFLLADLAEDLRRELQRHDAARRRRRRPTASISASVGHGALWTDPGRHHDQTSSVTNGRNGANSRSNTDSAVSSAALADAASASPWSP